MRNALRPAGRSRAPSGIQTVENRRRPLTLTASVQHPRTLRDLLRRTEDDTRCLDSGHRVHSAALLMDRVVAAVISVDKPGLPPVHSAGICGKNRDWADRCVLRLPIFDLRFTSRRRVGVTAGVNPNLALNLNRPLSHLRGRGIKIKSSPEIRRCNRRSDVR